MMKQGIGMAIVALAAMTFHGLAHAQKTLGEVRADFESSIRFAMPSDPAPEPPAGVLSLVKYPSAPGDMTAYLSPDPQDGKQHPAIIWITGGDCNAIGDVWKRAPADNDQTASSYREAGIIMMYPSLRGANGNPGQHEAFYGEVDDVLAAYRYLARQPYVDPKRIYLGGHSTGGTLALLTAETENPFRAVFSFGPVASIVQYGPSLFPINLSAHSRSETLVRSPIYWTASITNSVFVIEGAGPDGNVDVLRLIKKHNQSPSLQFIEVRDKDHFSVLKPANDIIAGKIVQDTDLSKPFSLSEQDFQP